MPFSFFRLCLLFPAAICLLLASGCSKENQPDTQPVLQTRVYSFADSTATLGGNVVTDGGKKILAVGVCYGTKVDPTVDGQRAETNAVQTGLFTVIVKNLLANTTYHVRAFAKTEASVFYGEDQTFTTRLLVGSKYRGGTVCYIGPGTSSGLIVAPDDAPHTAKWGCKEAGIFTDTWMFTGAANTTNITIGCIGIDNAARYCLDYSINGYDDWYLPSLQELEALQQSPVAASWSGRYWSSSAFNNEQAWHVLFDGNGSSSATDKSEMLKIRPIRAF